MVTTSGRPPTRISSGSSAASASSAPTGDSPTVRRMTLRRTVILLIPEDLTVGLSGPGTECPDRTADRLRRGAPRCEAHRRRVDALAELVAGAPHGPGAVVDAGAGRVPQIRLVGGVAQHVVGQTPV